MTRDQQTGVSPTAIPRVRIGWIHPFLEILEEIGAPFDQIMWQADLPSLAVDNPEALVPTANIYRFVELASKTTGMSDLGLRAGSRLDIELLLTDAESSWTRPGVLRSIKNFISAALESSSNVEMWMEPRSDPERTTEFFYRGTFGPDHAAFPVVEQYMVALMVRWVRYGADPRWNPAQVNIRTASIPEATLRALAGDAEVRCEQHVTSIVFPSQPFMGPMEDLPKKGSAIWRRHRKSLRDTAVEQDLSASLRVILPAYLPDGSPTIQQAARLAGTSVRTLQRRLGDQGVTYSQLLEDLRHDLAIYLLRDPGRQAAEVSNELGYRDPAIFTRAFRRWTGTTPGRFRETLHARASD
jgi:AraC-like DNA-binding protein